MDNIFGVGLPELILIAIIAGIVLGPERIVVGARWLGRATSQLQGVSRSFFRQLNAEIDGMDPSGELKETMAELNQLRRQVDELRAEFMGVATGATNEIRQTMAELEDEVGSIAPPSLLSGGKSPKNGGQEIFRPPSLLPLDPDATDITAAPLPPVGLPKRADTGDDPE